VSRVKTTRARTARKAATATKAEASPEAVDAAQAWIRAGSALLAVDPERFRRYLAAVEAIVALHETSDPAGVLAERLPLIADGPPTWGRPGKVLA
jgi:hypothetical protein